MNDHRPHVFLLLGALLAACSPLYPDTPTTPDARRLGREAIRTPNRAHVLAYSRAARAALRTPQPGWDRGPAAEHVLSMLLDEARQTPPSQRSEITEELAWLQLEHADVLADDPVTPEAMREAAADLLKELPSSMYFGTWERLRLVPELLDHPDVPFASGEEVLELCSTTWRRYRMTSSRRPPEDVREREVAFLSACANATAERGVGDEPPYESCDGCAAATARVLQRRSRRSPVALRLAILSDPNALAELRSATDHAVAMRRRLHYVELEDYLAFATRLDDAETTQFAHDLAALEERLLTEAGTSVAEELPEACRSSSDLEELAERVNDRAAHHYRIRRVRCDAEVGDCQLFYTRICRSPGRASARVRRGHFRIDACTPANPRSARAVLRLLHREEGRPDGC